jgi:two-component system, OmpR family, KDP operon response regulator KdpE
MQQTTKPQILIVDDEPQIRNMLRITLQAADFKTEETATGKSAVRLVTSIKPDLMLLDLGLPDVDGLDVLSQIREFSQMPVIVVSARDQSETIVDAFNRGADDYVTKPFSMEILIARINANLRKSVKEQAGDVELKVGDIVINLLRHEVTMKGEVVDLSPKEYALLSYLMRHHGKMLTHRQLLQEVWGSGHVEDTQYLRVYMGQLRRKIEPDPENPRYIITEAGIGYRLDEPTEYRSEKRA